MANIDLTKPELVWPGKYNENGTRKAVPRMRLPSKVLETINESRATRQEKREGRGGAPVDDGWRNNLIGGDTLLVRGALGERCAGKFFFIYTAPPFATGADFSFVTHI